MAQIHKSRRATMSLTIEAVDISCTRSPDDEVSSDPSCVPLQHIVRPITILNPYPQQRKQVHELLRLCQDATFIAKLRLLLQSACPMPERLQRQPRSRQPVLGIPRATPVNPIFLLWDYRMFVVAIRMKRRTILSPGYFPDLRSRFPLHRSQTTDRQSQLVRI